MKGLPAYRIHGPELEASVKGVRGGVHVVHGGLVHTLKGVVGFPLLSAQAQGHPARMTLHVNDVAHHAAMRDKLAQFRDGVGDAAVFNGRRRGRSGQSLQRLDSSSMR